MTASGITRDVVLAAATGLRTSDPSTSTETSTDAALRAIIDRTVSSGSTDLADYTAYPTAPGGLVDGVLIDVSVYSTQSGQTRSATIVALAATDEGCTLSGTARISTTSQLLGKVIGATGLGSSTLSGDVFVSSPLDTAAAGALTVTASGHVLSPRAQAADAAPAAAQADPADSGFSIATDQGAAAKALYDRKVKAAAAAYKKAKKKAGRSKAKKKAAKRAYDKKRAAYKAAYRKALAAYAAAQHSGSASTPTTPPATSAPVPAVPPAGSVSEPVADPPTSEPSPVVEPPVAETPPPVDPATTVARPFSLSISTDQGWALSA